MLAKFSSRPYQQIAEDTKAACDWLDSLGFDSNSTRFGYYKRYLSKLARAVAPETVVHWTKDEYLEFFEVAVDADELCRIHSGLGSLSDDAITARVKRAIKGQCRITKEAGNSRTGRDFSFELATAATFVARRLDVDFGTEADARINFGSAEVFVECKRPASENGVEEAVNDGLKQLKARFDTAANTADARGVLVLSAAKCINPNFLQLVAPTPQLVSDSAAAYVTAFVKRHKRHWIGRTDNRVIAVTTVLDAPAYIHNLRREFVVHETGVWPNHRSLTPTRDHLILHNLGWTASPV